jgi:hypothetical protein
VCAPNQILALYFPEFEPSLHVAILATHGIPTPVYHDTPTHIHHENPKKTKKKECKKGEIF